MPSAPSALRLHIDAVHCVHRILRSYGGIRIEDNVRATAGDPENLTRDAFALT